MHSKCSPPASTPPQPPQLSFLLPTPCSLLPALTTLATHFTTFYRAICAPPKPTKPPHPSPPQASKPAIAHSSPQLPTNPKVEVRGQSPEPTPAAAASAAQTP